MYRVGQIHDIIKQKLTEKPTKKAVECGFYHFRLFFLSKNATDLS